MTTDTALTRLRAMSEGEDPEERDAFIDASVRIARWLASEEGMDAISETIRAEVLKWNGEPPWYGVGEKVRALICSKGLGDE